jgi:hypothetical protein
MKCSREMQNFLKEIAVHGKHRAWGVETGDAAVSDVKCKTPLRRLQFTKRGSIGCVGVRMGDATIIGCVGVRMGDATMAVKFQGLRILQFTKSLDVASLPALPILRPLRGNLLYVGFLLCISSRSRVEVVETVGSRQRRLLKSKGTGACMQLCTPKVRVLSALSLSTVFDVITFDDGSQQYLFCGVHESVCVAFKLECFLTLIASTTQHEMFGSTHMYCRGGVGGSLMSL